MTQEEIRKLLGGYATNTLSERERTALFEAALDDQGLFDALQNEDALRELLADPVSREQVRQALEPATAERRRASWMLQPWLIGWASLAVAAVIAIGVFVLERPPALKAPAPPIASTQIAQSPIEPKLEAPQPAPLIPVPAPRRLRPTPPISRETARSAQLAAAPSAGLVLPEAMQKQDVTAGIAADAPLYTGPLVRYSVLRSGPSGDAIRIEVVSELAGSLALYRIDAGGQWQRVFPANGPRLPIVANTTYQIPDDPIAISGNQDKLRLVIEPAAVLRLQGQISAGSLNQPRAQALEKKTTAPAPLVIEIPIGPN
jgi:hypothetical protein